MRLHVIVVVTAAGLGLLSGCSKDLVVVVPASDGHVGGVVVETARNKFVLDQPYAEASPGLFGLKQGTSTPKDVGTTFSKALAAQPIPPKNYTLYFMFDSKVLVPESRGDFEEVFKEIARRKVAEIVITGHTDTMGTDDHNDTLSLQRANSIEDLFTARGLTGDSIVTAGRGKREPLVNTGDQVPEPRNRRVVITVR